ncbi:MAG: D-2-hydroxyacid dehydrogenase [Prevotella sp.]|nr:D-2-hydroxyacid dehydrogenase [Prevotella sp.]
MKIVILDGYSINPGDLDWKQIEEIGELTVYDRTAPEDIVSAVGDAEIVLTNKVVFTAEIMDRLPQLKYIGVLATGYNVVDTVAAAERGIIVTNIAAYSTDSVAQMTFAHLLNITNRVGHYGKQVKNLRWSYNKDFCYWDTKLMELAGKTMGIIGFGKIGMRVAEIARCFGMDVFVVTHRNSADLPEGIQKTTLDGVLAVSDVLSLHCPLNDETREIINEATLAKMKPTVILINTGRGALINEDAVAKALCAGTLAGFGADVLCQEPPSADNPLFKAPNCYITPHTAWATPEARHRLVAIAAQNIKAYLSGAPINVVN